MSLLKIAMEKLPPFHSKDGVWENFESLPRGKAEQKGLTPKRQPGGRTENGAHHVPGATPKVPSVGFCPRRSQRQPSPPRH